MNHAGFANTPIKSGPHSEHCSPAGLQDIRRILEYEFRGDRVAIAGRTVEYLRGEIDVPG
jgi:hypothetical protein